MAPADLLLPGVNAPVVVPPSQFRHGDHFFPTEPATLAETGLTFAEVEGLVLKFLYNCGTGTGRQIAQQLKLSFGIVREVLDVLKLHLLVAHKGVASMSDFQYELTESGLNRARQRAQRCTYFGAAPVRFSDYVDSVTRQAVDKCKPRLADLRRAFQDLSLPAVLISQVGQAVNAGRSMFLYGPPGNGKTSIAERVIRSVSETLWIPRCVTVTDEIIRLFDPACHELAELTVADAGYDGRWVKIKRPTVVAGGELTLDMLECNLNPSTGINEAPLQMKSNGGALVIDDFGRQRISTTELLNRWIVPLEKGFDYLTLPSGRHIQIPFAQLLVFSTNLDPRQIVDEAFLRRIPYKIEVFDPSEADFQDLFCKMATKLGFEFSPQIVDYLLQTHYRVPGRRLRYCHARDVLLQVKNLCEFHELPLRLEPKAIDVAALNYFAGLSTDH